MDSPKLLEALGGHTIENATATGIEGLDAGPGKWFVASRDLNDNGDEALGLDADILSFDLDDGRRLLISSVCKTDVDAHLHLWIHKGEQ